MSKDLIKGFLLAHNAPKEVMDAFNMFLDSQALRNNPPTFTHDDLSSFPIDSSLCHLKLSFRTRNCLKNCGINNMKQLLSLTERDLLYIPNFGRKSLNELRELIAPRKFPVIASALLDYSGGKTFPTYKELA